MNEEIRLVDAEAILKTHRSETELIGKDWTVGDLAAAIELAPTISATQVTRCKDCKHRPTNNSTDDSVGGLDIEFPDNKCPCQCPDGFYNYYPKDDWFCGNGEPKRSDI